MIDDYEPEWSDDGLPDVSSDEEPANWDSDNE